MKKRILKKSFILLAFLGLASFNMNAQSWEFKDAATGTTVWNGAGNLTPIQKSGSVVYTTTGAGSYALISTTTAGVNAGNIDNSEVLTAKSRRLMAITLRVEAGGPTALRMSHPKETTGDWLMPCVQITTGDAEFKTYYLDMATWASPRAEWDGTKNIFELQFKTWDGTNVGANYITASKTIEIDRIEFVNNVWQGGGSNENSGNNGNWYFGKPATDGTEDILFPSGLAVVPNLNVTLNVKSISFGAGAQLINDEVETITVVNNMMFGVGASFVPHASSTLTIGGSEHKVEIKDNNWHLLSSPVDIEQYNDAWVSANAIASGTLLNRGISTYDNGTPDGTTGHWRYFQSGGSDTTFDDGIGYSIKSSSATGGVLEFTGAFQEGTISPAISQSNTNYNLIGNPYNAYVDIAAFITENTAKLTGPGQTIYVWNASGSAYTGLTTGFLQPGQAFFVDSDIEMGTVDFTLAMQGHSAGATFYKNSNTSIELKVSDGNSNKTTSINYLAGKTTGLDSRFDIGLFNGVKSDLRVYTYLLDDNEGIAFEKQSLPNTDLESMIIPVGVKAEAGKEITFTAEALNLPSTFKVVLEDRLTNTFTQLDEVNSEYKITLVDALDGVGRFYLHTASSVLSIDESVLLSGVSIFKTNSSTLRIVGLPQGKASISLFNILGKQVMTTSFEANGNKDISLQKLATGVYFVKVQTVTGKISKKIILE